MRKIFCTILLIAFHGSLIAQYQTEIIIEKDEFWWGCAVGLGATMPFERNVELFDISSQNKNNQVVPLLLSNCGRYLWSDSPFTFEMTNDRIIVKSAYEKPAVMKVGNTLKESFLTASKAHFQSSGVFPIPCFLPCHNTIPGLSLCTIRIRKMFCVMLKTSSNINSRQA